MEILDEGGESERYSILPHICLIRSECFLNPLLRLLRSHQPGDQLFAAIALGSLGDSRAVAPLEALFKRPGSLRGPGCQSLQTAIIFALGETGGEEAVESLLRIFRIVRVRDTFRRRRRKLVVTALGTLAQQGSERAVRMLLSAAQSDEPPVRAGAVSELGVAFWHCPNCLPDSVWERMEAMLDDSDPEVREAAFSAIANLAQLGSRKAERAFASQE